MSGANERREWWPWRRYPAWIRRLGLILVVALLLGGLIRNEAVTSSFQSRYFSGRASRLTYRVEPGPSDSVAFPSSGPFDERRGFTRIPEFTGRLTGEGYTVSAQARMSAGLLALTRRNVYPVHRDKLQAGLLILDADADTLYRSRFPRRIYTDPDSIPGTIVRALLFIENRELLDFDHPHRNPAVEWDRFVKAILDQAIGFVRKGHSRPGGSTLATQLEKFRHSTGGVTRSWRDKLLQMEAASYRAYLDGRDTRETRRRIVMEYLNSVPLASIPGHGEVIGLGEGLWAWFETDFDAVNRLLSGDDPGDEAALARRAEALKKVLALLVSQKRPAEFLIQNRERLARDVNAHLRLLGEAGVIRARLRDAALAAPLSFRQSQIVGPRPSYIDRKAANAVRTRLVKLLGVGDLYALDRLDLTVHTTVVGSLERRLLQVLRQAGDPGGVDALGLRGPRLLDRGDPGRVVYSLTLYEATPSENVLRVQVDNWDQPLDINEGTRLDLGSTAKLRTLVNYLEVVARMHATRGGTPRADLRAASARTGAANPLLRWVQNFLASSADTSLGAVLQGALERTYSSSTSETFFTAGGRHRFQNLSRSDDGKLLTVREAFRGSVNLVFIRLMRDLVRAYTVEIPGHDPAMLEDPLHPRRREYLERFADFEGKQHLAAFYPRYQGLDPDSALDVLAAQAGTNRRRLAALFRFVRPEAGEDSLRAFLAARLPRAGRPGGGGEVTDPAPAEVRSLFRAYPPDRTPLQDQGALAGVHPLELWLVAYLQEHPRAAWRTVVEAGGQARLDAYRWLLTTRHKERQDQRIRIMLEEEAFRLMHRDWQRLGYPFESLVPSLATSIGSSGDRPAALAELVGILVNDGVQKSSRRLGRLRFASDTPFETVFDPPPASATRVLPAAVAAAARGALVNVVEEGTARRCRGAFVRPDGTPARVGGKTGTGDHRFETFNRRGLVVESKVVNRTATFVFFIDDRFFGSLTAFVPGAEAADYAFTSSLPVHLLARMAPEIGALLGP